MADPFVKEFTKFTKELDPSTDWEGQTKELQRRMVEGCHEECSRRGFVTCKMSNQKGNVVVHYHGAGKVDELPCNSNYV